MAEFNIDKENFKKFLDICSMKGKIQFRDKKGIDKNLFSSFYMNVKDDTLEVLTVDPYRRKTEAQFIKREIACITEGQIPIVEQEAIDLCLKGKGISGLITVSNKNDIITLESEKDFYEIRQKGRIFYEELKEEEKKETIKHLESWKDWHQFEELEEELEDGTTKKTGVFQLFLNHPKVKVPYQMRIVISKNDWLKVVGDSLNIMKDNKTRLVCKDGKFYGFKGEANAKIKSKHELDFENLLPENELIEFDQEFYNVQSIMPNLFDKIELNIRKVKANNTVAIFIRSIDEKSKIEANIGLISIVKEKKEE